MVTSHTDTLTCNIYSSILLLVVCFFLVTVSQLPLKMLNSQHLPFQNIIHPPFLVLRRSIQQTAPVTHTGALLFGEELQIYKSPCQRRKPSPCPARTHHPYRFVLLMQLHLSRVQCPVSSSITVTNFPTNCSGSSCEGSWGLHLGTGWLCFRRLWSVSFPAGKAGVAFLWHLWVFGWSLTLR